MTRDLLGEQAALTLLVPQGRGRLARFNGQTTFRIRTYLMGQKRLHTCLTSKDKMYVALFHSLCLSRLNGAA